MRGILVLREMADEQIMQSITTIGSALAVPLFAAVVASTRDCLHCWAAFLLDAVAGGGTAT